MARWHTTEFDLLPEEAFQPRGWKGSMTLEGGGKGGGGAPAADPNIGIAQRQLADLATEQWKDFKTTIYPKLTALADKQESRADEQWALDKETGQFQLAQAKKGYERYEQGAIPAMERLKADADQYNEAGYQEQMAEAAKADIDNQMEQQRQQTAMRQRAYGIDPTSGVAQGNMQAQGVQQALAGATAMTQVRQAAKDLGLQKQANVYNMYAGLPAQANQNTALGLQAGAQGFNAGQSALGNWGSVGSSLNQSAQTAMSGWNNVGNLGVAKYNADINKYNAEAQNNPFNVMLGAATGVGTKYALSKIV